MIREDFELFREIPKIRRARGWRLYAENGSRIVDLWQYGGRALLGHNPPGLLRAFKNSAEKGLFAPFPHFAEDRLRKALAALLPGRRFRFFSGGDALGAALEAAGKNRSCRAEALWRPFLDIPSGPLFIPVLPFPFPGAPAVLALDPETDSVLEGVLPAEPLSPAALAAAARCVWDLAAVSPGRGRPRFPKLDALNALDTLAAGAWQRRGIYLSRPPGAASGYPALFRRFLDGGFLLPPSPSQPAILPGELSPGEEAKLAALLSAE
ncbi:MAG: hypothetical protein LBH35_07270 [Treponema sp.]|jgi:hypothetical protein|nr:hypothetical protein [Treponema sp.]